MSRFDRPILTDPEAELARAGTDERRNRLLFDWLCDGGDPPSRPADWRTYIASLRGRPTPFKSRSPIQDDPAPPVTDPPKLGVRDVYLLSKPAHLRRALTDTATFRNRPYAALGGATFLLGLDPPAPGEFDWHGAQKRLLADSLGAYDTAALRQAATLAVDQAALTALARPDFDLAAFAEQGALRYMGLLFGYGFQDHPLLEEASRATYRALQYLAIGQHFVTEPLTLPVAQQALGRLVTRTAALMDDYVRLERSPRRFGWQPGRALPDGVQPWSELGLRRLGVPLLRHLSDVDNPTSGRDRALIAATLLAGTAGNLQSAVCLVVQSLLLGPPDELEAMMARARGVGGADAFQDEVAQRLAALPPIPVVPRRTASEVSLDGVTIPAGTDCLLVFDGLARCPHAATADTPPDVFGAVAGAESAHACLGRGWSLPLVAAMVRRVLLLPGLRAAHDGLTGETLPVERLWGFACTRYPLRFDREEHRGQQNLIVSMKVKPPMAENAMHLRRLIAAGAPRIEHVLRGFGHVHFAWFEFSDDDSQLVLRTIFDGQFDAYVQHFALYAGDLFDGLFEYLEGAPPRPVAEHPHEFVETLRRFNRAPLAGYLFSAYPKAGAEQIYQLSRDW